VAADGGGGGGGSESGDMSKGAEKKEMCNILLN